MSEKKLTIQEQKALDGYAAIISLGKTLFDVLPDSLYKNNPVLKTDKDFLMNYSFLIQYCLLRGLWETGNANKRNLNFLSFIGNLLVPLEQFITIYAEKENSTLKFDYELFRTFDKDTYDPFFNYLDSYFRPLSDDITSLLGEAYIESDNDYTDDFIKGTKKLIRGVLKKSKGDVTFLTDADLIMDVFMEYLYGPPIGMYEKNDLPSA